MGKWSKYKSWKSYKSYLLTKWFIEWVDDEYDLETIEATKTKLVQQETKIKQLIDTANRVTIKGFRNE